MKSNYGVISRLCASSKLDLLACTRELPRPWMCRPSYLTVSGEDTRNLVGGEPLTQSPSCCGTRGQMGGGKLSPWHPRYWRAAPYRSGERHARPSVNGTGSNSYHTSGGFFFPHPFPRIFPSPPYYYLRVDGLLWSRQRGAIFSRPQEISVISWGLYECDIGSLSSLPTVARHAFFLLERVG